MQDLCLFCATIPLAPVEKDLYFNITLSASDPVSVAALEHARKLSVSS